MLFTLTFPLYEAVVDLMSPCLQTTALPVEVVRWRSCSSVQGGWEAGEEMSTDMQTAAAGIDEMAGLTPQY